MPLLIGDFAVEQNLWSGTLYGSEAVCSVVSVYTHACTLVCLLSLAGYYQADIC